MLSLRHADELGADDGAQALHALARQKVQLAMAALGQPQTARPVSETSAEVAPVVDEPPVAEQPPVGDAGDAGDEDAKAGDEDLVISQALERMHEQLGDVCALDRDGRELSWRELAQIVIGPLAARSRDADTAAALLTAVTPEPTSPAPIYADLLAERREGHDAVCTEHADLDGGGHRYVFRA